MTAVMVGWFAPAVPWAVWAVVLPLGLAALALPAGRLAIPWLPLAGAFGGVLTAAGLAVQIAWHGALHQALGGWSAPLGIELRADGLSAAMVLTVALVTAPVAVYALIEFAHAGGRERRRTPLFWPLLLFLWGSLNAVFLSADLFNLYVALELLTLAAVALVTLEGEPPALVAGLRYLFTALLGSLAYLLGVAWGAARFGPAATIGGLVHLVHQGLMKITLFFCAGGYAETLHVHRVDELDGIGRRMPWTTLAFTVAALGMIGVPPVAGFVSKWYLGIGGLRGGQLWVIFVLAGSSLLNAAYFLPPIYRAWFKRPARAWRSERPKRRRLETDPGLLVPPVTTALMALGAGLFAAFEFSPLGWATLIAERGYGR